MSKYTVAQVTASRMLMIGVSKQGFEKQFDKILELAKANNGEYDVRLTVNGVEVDLAEYEAEVGRQFDRILADACRTMLAEQLLGLDLEIEKVIDAAKEASRGLRVQAAKMLGFDPWKWQRED